MFAFAKLHSGESGAICEIAMKFVVDVSNEGNVVAEWGATYPVRYTYDSAGRRTSLSTTRDGACWDTTTWEYDAATGNCVSKIYADGSTVYYTYTPDSLPLRTTYASGRWAENMCNAKREVVKMGVVTFDFRPKPTVWNLLKSWAKAEGEIEESYGLCLKVPVTISSTPQQDIKMLRTIRQEAKNPPFYNGLFHNCVFWSVGAVNYGM